VYRSDFSGSKLCAATGLAPVDHNVVYVGNGIYHAKIGRSIFIHPQLFKRQGGKNA
jgi:hypothetical protein